jgi:hypothetical protein
VGLAFVYALTRHALSSHTVRSPSSCLRSGATHSFAAMNRRENPTNAYCDMNTSGLDVGLRPKRIYKRFVMRWANPTRRIHAILWATFVEACCCWANRKASRISSEATPTAAPAAVEGIATVVETRSWAGVISCGWWYDLGDVAGVLLSCCLYMDRHCAANRIAANRHPKGHGDTRVLAYLRVYMRSASF